jgi:IPT/TIG domain
MKYKAVANIFRVILNADGSAPVASSLKGIPLNVGDSGLDLTQAPNGNLIEISYSNNSLFVHVPVEPLSDELEIKCAHPRRGPNSGNQVLTIFGINFLKDGPNPIVMVGDRNCPIKKKTNTQIECTLAGGVGTVDVVVTNGNSKSEFKRGFRFISGMPDAGFQIPVWK